MFNTRTATELDTQRLQHWRAGLGVDWNAPLGLFVNVQYLHDHVSKAPANLIRPTRERIATAFVRRQFLYETLSTELRWYGSLEDHDQLIRGAVRYSLSDTTSVALSADLFEGDDRGVFGQFASRDQVTLTLQHTF